VNMTDEQPSTVRGAAAAVSLPKFWASSPAAWFRTAEAFFALRGVTDNVEKFYMVLCALSEANVDQARSIVEAEPTQDSFRLLREALVSTHTLSEYHMVDHIVNMEPLNGRKPTELLAAMSKYRPADDKHFFAYHFLQRLQGRSGSCCLASRWTTCSRWRRKLTASWHCINHSSMMWRLWLSPRNATRTPPSPSSRKGLLVREPAAGRSSASLSGSAAALTRRSGARRCAGCTFVSATRRGGASSRALGLRPRKTKEPGRSGQRIRCWGSCSRDLLLSGVKYTWSFLLADVSFPILGIDFLREHQLVVDVCGGALIPRASVLAAADCGLYAVFQPPQQSPGPDKPTYAQVVSGAAAAVPGGRQRGVGSSEAPLHAAGGEQAGRWQGIIKEFPTVVQPFSVSTSPSHGVQHFIQTTGRPTYAKFRRLDPQRLAAARRSSLKCWRPA
jgi:hypothetical protein